jgi:hypothetical protein
MHQQPTSPHPSTLSRRGFLTKVGAVTGGAAALAVVGPVAVVGGAPVGTGPEDFDAAVPTAWFDLARTLVQTTPGFTPPVAARAFGYIGVTVYEAVVRGSPHYRSLEGVLPDLRGLPGGRRAVHWAAAANAALVRIVDSLFVTTSDGNREAIERLARSFTRQFGRETSGAVLRNSVELGSGVARAILNWSRGDGGHDGYLRNFPSGYVPPTGPGSWVPTPPGFQPALQPFWGENRCFALASGAQCPPGDHPAFSADPGSSFFIEALKVFDAVNHLTAEQEAVALFWSDDPGVTATPPGHSISIATQVLRLEEASLMEAAETYAKVGIAVNDAFIGCWTVKYRYNLLRPVTYIRRHIEPTWLPLLNTPPFPEYTSGHSVQSGAAFQVLADLFGDEYPFDDDTHDDRGLAHRHFDSFHQAAAEAAASRLYGGIHFGSAIERGLDQGRCIGRSVRALPFQR